MKKLFALLALVLGVVSCQTEPEGFDVVVGGEQEVMLNVSLPEATRATSAEGFDFTNFASNTQFDLRFILEIRHNNQVVREVKTSESTSATFPVRLAPGREYTFTVWADLVAEDTQTDLFYNTTSLAAITLKDDVAEDVRDIVELRDAYTHTDTFNFTAEQRERLNMTLTRPFAKVRVVATDLEKVTAFGINPAKGEVVYGEVYSAFNAVDGNVTGSAISKEVNYNVIANNYTEQNGQLTVFADYIFVPTAENTQPTIKFTLDVKDTNSESIKMNNFNTTIPVSRNKVTSIVGNVLTQGDNINVSVDNAFTGEDVHVDSRNAAQIALDNAAANTTIYLQKGVNYGTLYLRPVAGGAQTKEVDWLGNNYRFETYSLFENLTIVGAEGATVDAIKIEGGTYYNTEHSQSDLYPVMLSLIELKNVVIDGVTFTGKGGYDPQGHGNVINLSGNNIKVDGLTLTNCVLNNGENNARLLYKTESTTHVHNYAYNDETFTFIPSLKDITITECTLNGGYIGLELRESENVTITNNVFNVADRNILLPVNTGCTYSGNITITGNVSNNAQERFVRADGTGDAVVVISNNFLNNYQGADADYIKVTNGNNVTIENNTVTIRVSTQEAFVNELKKGGNIELAAGEYTFPAGNVYAGEIKIFAQSTRSSNVIVNLPKSIYIPGTTLTMENIILKVPAGLTYNESQFAFIHHATAFNMNNCTIDGGRLRLNVNEANIDNCTFNVTTKSGFDGYGLFYYGKSGSTVNVSNSTFTTCGKAIVLYNEAASELNLNVNKCTFNSSDNTTDKTAIQMHSELGIHGTVNITESTATGFANINGGLWYDVNNNTGKPNNKFTVSVDGETVAIKGATAVHTADALNQAIESGKTVYIASIIEDASIKLPANLSNFTLTAFKGKGLKNSTISAADGNAYHYENLTFDGITFDNSRILLTGWRNGEEVIKNLTVTNCIFKNLDDTTNTAPVHINKDASEAVENFTFTNNVINGATGGSKSGVYAQVTGEVVFENNVINNVSFRPYVIQITTDDAIADTFTVRGNTFSGSSVGRAQGLGSNDAGTDTVTLVVSGNIFKDITGAQQICYWNFNAATTTADLSKNYYSIDIEANPSRIYYNAAATSVEDLKTMGVYPFYTELNADGTINLNSLKQAE